MKKIVMVGGGGHALSVADSIMSRKEYEIVGYSDIKPVSDFPFQYLGTDEVLGNVYRDGVHFAAISVGYIGNSNNRERLYDLVKRIGYEIPPIIDRSAYVSEFSDIGEGAFIGKLAIINAAVAVGRMCIINSGAIIEHQNCIGDYTHIACGAVLCGNVSVGNKSFIGANSTIVQGIKLGNSIMVGAGSVVTKNIGDNVKFIQKREEVMS